MNPDNNSSRSDFEKSYTLVTARKMQMEIDDIISKKNKNLSDIRLYVTDKKHMRNFH